MGFFSKVFLLAGGFVAGLTVAAIITCPSPCDMSSGAVVVGITLAGMYALVGWFDLVED